MKREHMIGLMVVLLVVGGGLWWRGKKLAQTSQVLPAEGEGVEIEDRASELAKRFGVVLPDNLERAELKDVTGGVGSGIATRSLTGDKFELTILAALPDPEKGSWYAGWLVKDEPFAIWPAGNLRIAKGGFLLEFSGEAELNNYKKVVVTLETKEDKKPETHVLEGSFN